MSEEIKGPTVEDFQELPKPALAILLALSNSFSISDRSLPSTFIDKEVIIEDVKGFKNSEEFNLTEETFDESLKLLLKEGYFKEIFSNGNTYYEMDKMIIEAAKEKLEKL